jgi:pimeloyl-ACP methyl ester carboxylesterase
VIELADTLHLDRFSVMGISGGGPYVSACAFKIPQRLNAAAIVSGMGTLDMPQPIIGMSQSDIQEWWLARRTPWLWRLIVRIMLPRRLRHDPDYSYVKTGVTESDRAALELPEVTRIIRESAVEAIRQGTRGVAMDYTVIARSWGFRLQDIPMEVHLWHGDDDRNAPPAMARYVADAIPNCRARFLPGEGHFDLIGNHIEEILTVLTS